MPPEACLSLCAVLTPLASTFAAPQRLTPRTPRSLSAGERPFTGRASSAATASDDAAEPVAAGTLRHYSMLTLQRIVGVGIFIGVYFLQRLFGSKTPVGGMLLVFFSMLGIEAINPRLAQRLFKFLEPGYRFLVKWLIVFFVPALVRVSLIHVDLGVGGLFRVFVLLLVGWFITFGLTAGVASLFPEPQMEVQPEKEPEQPSTSGPARFPFIRYFVLMFFAAVAASAGVAPGVDQTVFMMCAALAGFTLGKRLPPKVQKFIHPLFICAGATFGAAALWIVLEHPGLKAMDLIRIYSEWPGGGALLYFLLPIAVVSLGMLLFENRVLIRKDFGPILVTSAFSSLLTMSSAPLLSRLFGLPHDFALSTPARCALSPIAMGMASVLGSPPPIAVAMTTFSGVLGVMLGPTMFKVLNLRKARARGLALGCSSHGVGVPRPDT
ncbi:PLGG1 [Symbiodinium microadriaticum]|nr:PLGG1 [Symbiodinium microadriaticum]